MKIFDAKSIFSISQFSNDLYNACDKMDDVCLIVNLHKAIDALNEVRVWQYEYEKTYELLILINNISFYCKSERFIVELLKTDMLLIYSNMTEFQLRKVNFEPNSVRSIFSTLETLAYYSRLTASAAVKYNFHKMAIELLDRIKFGDDALLCLYDILICFIQRLSSYKETKDALNALNIIPRLLQYDKIIDSLIRHRQELKYTKMSLISTVANLLSTQQLNKLPINDEFIFVLNETLKQIIAGYRANKSVYENSRYYIVYEINKTKSYLNAKMLLTIIVSIVVNDTIKEKLFEEGITLSLEHIMQNGNKIEIEKSIQLLYNLCLNDGICNNIRENYSFLQIIEKISRNINADQHVNITCNRILEMVSKCNVEKVWNCKCSPGYDNFIMISYHRRDKEHCLKISDKLKASGYNTWLNTLHNKADIDAIERAAVVLICYSLEYKMNNHCRLEAEHALKRNKTIISIKMQSNYEPDGWLISKLCVDLSLDFSVSTSFNILLTEINDLMPKKVDLNMSTKAQTKEAQLPSLSNNMNFARNLSNNEVNDWFIYNNMNGLAQVFKAYTSVAFRALWEMRQKDYIQFCSQVDKEIENACIHIPLVEKLTFYELFQHLFEL